MKNVGWLSEVVTDMIYFSYRNGMHKTALALEETMIAIELDVTSNNEEGLKPTECDEAAQGKTNIYKITLYNSLKQ